MAGKRVGSRFRDGLAQEDQWSLLKKGSTFVG